MSATKEHGVADGDEGGERSATDPLGLEARLRRLEEIVSQLEADEVELEKALALFEEGVAHVREAEGILARTELRVDELLGDGPATRPLPSEGE